MTKTYTISAKTITSLDVALLCKRGLEAAGYEVTMEGYENTNKIHGHTEEELHEVEEFVENCEINRH